MQLSKEVGNSDYFKFEKDYVALVFIGIVIFILNETTRTIFTNNKVNQINILYSISALIILFKYIYYLRCERIYVYTLLVFTGMIMVNDYYLGKNVAYFALMLTSLILPLFLSTIKLDEETSFKVFDKFLYIYNVLCITLLLSGLIDYITHGQIQYILAKYLIKGEMADLILFERAGGTYRFYSFIGHPLTNANYFLCFFSLNNICSKFYKSKMNKYLLVVITILGLILSGSKTAMLLGLFLILFCSEIKKYKWLYYLLFFVMAVILFNSSLFQENLMQRYLEGMKSGDISTGRNLLLNKWLNSDTEMPNWIFGGGGGYSRVISKSLGYGINFEYPLLMLAYDYSIIGVVIIYFVILLNPIICFIKNKAYYILINFIVLSLYLNGNNGIANFSDSMAQLCFIILLFKNTANHKKSL
ncbi:hypothetical protein [Clostridium sp. CF012]|uniref:hypothetical protein n=1 Tax=Clostridium sp. CF012 TaxID=2843319 RepID=UPI001C0BBB72|nr:hypothetical protein [Clostridium sp. CF012]MBU3142589.1 hypothetical protein [Clostridium sp. CF012]